MCLGARATPSWRPIIPVHEAGEADGALFIAMRFVSSGDLRRVLEQEGALPPGRAAEFISPVASALDAAHAAGLVHRDIKPANILVDVRQGRPDHVYLSDFGVSKGATASVSLTGTGQFLGTPDYSAPEQIQGRAVDGRTDQYALACVAYQLLTREAPFERDQGMAVLLAHLSEPPPSLSSRRPDLPEAADRVLAQALAKAPEKRYSSCGAFADALREAPGLVPYYPRGPASAPNHPRKEIAAPLSGFPGPAAEGTGKAAVPADPAAAVTIDSVPGGSPGIADLPAAVAIAADSAHPGAVPPVTPGVTEEDIPAAAATATAASRPAGKLGTADESDRLPGEAGLPATDADGPASAANVRTVGPHPPPSIPRSGSKLQPTRRPRRLLAISLAGAVLAVTAIAVPLLLASSPPSQRSPTSQGSPTSLKPVNTLAGGSVAFSPNSAIVATGSGTAVFLWNLTSPAVRPAPSPTPTKTP